MSQRPRREIPPPPSKKSTEVILAVGNFPQSNERRVSTTSRSTYVERAAVVHREEANQVVSAREETGHVVSGQQLWYRLLDPLEGQGSVLSGLLTIRATNSMHVRIEYMD